MMTRRAAALALGTLLGSSQAAADSGLPWNGPFAWDDYGAQVYETQYQPSSESSPTALAPPRPRRSMYGGFDIGVPVVLDVDRDLIRPGANLHVHGGLDLGYVAFFVHGGWRWIPVDFDKASDDNPQYEGEGRDPLKNPYFGLGVRGQVPNSSRLLPYLSASLDFNWWNFRESDVACAGGYYYWWCNDYDVYTFTPGFSGRLGTEVSIRNGLSVDLGLGVSMSFEGDFFDRTEVWLEPFLGLAYRR